MEEEIIVDCSLEEWPEEDLSVNVEHIKKFSINWEDII